MSTEANKTENVTFSVICPTYNHAPYIEQCIESVLNQTYRNWEMLILDDGSTDGTSEKVTPYLKDERINFYSQNNKGAEFLAENYNFLLSKARGKYITILEGDDYAESELLASHYQSLKQHPNAVLSFNRVQVMDLRHTWIWPKGTLNEVKKKIFTNNPTGQAYNELFLNCFIFAQGVTLKKDVLVQSGGFEKVVGLPTVDYPTWLKLASLGPFIFVDQMLAHWRRHKTQTTKLRIVNIYSLMIPVYERVYDNLSPDILRNITLTKEDVLKHAAVNITKVLIRGGNYQLQSHQWEQGRKLYFQSFLRWPKIMLFWRIKAVLGILFSYLKLPWMHWYQVVPKKLVSRISGNH